MQEDVNLLPQNRVFFPRGKLRRRNKGEEKERRRNQGKGRLDIGQIIFPNSKIIDWKKKRGSESPVGSWKLRVRVRFEISWNNGFLDMRYCSTYSSTPQRSFLFLSLSSSLVYF